MQDTGTKEYIYIHNIPQKLLIHDILFMLNTGKIFCIFVTDNEKYGNLQNKKLSEIFVF